MRIMAFLFLVTTLFVVSSCSLSPIPSQSASTYTITNWPKQARVKSYRASPATHTLLVSTPIASPGYRSSRMIYVEIPYQLRAYAEHQWIAPPADLLLPLLANRLRTTGAFRAVVTPPFSGAATDELNTQLLVLQQEFLRPVSVVRLSMEATLINVATGHVIASRVFQAVVPAPDNNPYSGVLATNKAAHDVIAQIARFTVTKTVSTR